MVTRALGSPNESVCLRLSRSDLNLNLRQSFAGTSFGEHRIGILGHCGNNKRLASTKLKPNVRAHAG